MAFFRQLKLLLWKNGLAAIRQPLWSFTLILWPLIIFIIIAVTRQTFPSVLRDACYVGPRNLPSTGFFPFIQTLMCNTDSNCHNTSRLKDQAAPEPPRRRQRSTDFSLEDLLQGTDLLDLAVLKDPSNDPAALVHMLNEILGGSYDGNTDKMSLMNTKSFTSLEDQDSMNKVLQTVNLLKRIICSMTLPLINTTSPNTASYAAVILCKSNNTVFEESLNALNKILTELIVTNPNELAMGAEFVLLLFDHLQDETSLWESLLALPELLSAGSVEEVLGIMKALLTNIQRVMQTIQKKIPEATATLSTEHPLLVESIHIIHYAQNWPGKDVSISLGDVVMLHNDSMSDVVKYILQTIQIPLDKAIALTLDQDMVQSYLCENSSVSIWMKTACSTGTVNMVLSWISPEKLAKQALLKWSNEVALHDVSFAKELLHRIMGSSLPEGQKGSNTWRPKCSVNTQPQSIEEELFLSVGKVVMEIGKVDPKLEGVIQSVLRIGFQSMKAATLTIDTVGGMMWDAFMDFEQVQSTYATLLKNQTEAERWFGHVLDSGFEVIMKIMTPKLLKCEDLLGPFEWLLYTKTLKIELWRKAFCHNSSSLEQSVLMPWLPLIHQAEELQKTFTGKANYSVTLPMILSEWHELLNGTQKFAELDKWFQEMVWSDRMDRMNWIPENSTYDINLTIQQRVFLSMVKLGEKFQKSQTWPVVKNYFHMINWILNYRDGNTTLPPNCTCDSVALAIQCETGLMWQPFVKAMFQVLMSPNPDFLVNYLKGTVALLQHVYGDKVRYLSESYLKNEIPGGDALSAYLINLMKNLDGYVQTIANLSDQKISDPEVMVPLLSNLLQSTGLKPLLPLLLSDSPPNVSTVLDVASKVGRLNQHIFTFNETDQTMPELEELMLNFLSLEGNLTISLSHIMGHSLLTYSNYFNPEDVARIRETIRPFTNQTSAGLVETILHAAEVLKTVADSDPTTVILVYVRQLQEFVISLYRLRLIQQHALPNGQLTPAQVLDLHLISKDFLNLLTPEGLNNLTQAGPAVAQNIVAQRFVELLPLNIKPEAARFISQFKALQYNISQCADGQDCLAGIPKIFAFLDQILDMMLSANGNVTITTSANPFIGEKKNEEMTCLFFSLLLPPNDAAHVKTFKQALHFIRLVVATQNITVSDVQKALRQSNLTLEELNNITALAGAANVNNLMVNVMEIINAQQCFDPQHNQMVTVECVMGLIKGVSSFLTQVPALRNDTAIISLIPLIINNITSGVAQRNFSSSPNIILAQTMKITLDNIKKGLQLNHLNTSAIMNEIRVVEGLIQLIANPEPLRNLSNPALNNDPLYAQEVYLKIVHWYLKRLENITSNSSEAVLLKPLFYLAQMQVTLQLKQLEVTSFVTNQLDYLINNLQYPIDGSALKQIGQATAEIFPRLFKAIRTNLEFQNHIQQSMIFNTTILDATELQIMVYTDLIKKWMNQPNVPLVITNMLQWGNSSVNASTAVTDLQQLLQTMVPVLSADQLAYLSIIKNITQSLNRAVMVAEQPGGLQSDHFSAAFLEVVQKAMQALTTATQPLPTSVQQNILGIVNDLLKLTVRPNMNFTLSRNISLHILKKAKTAIQQLVPQMYAEYVLAGIKVATTYFESINTVGGSDNWNQIVLNEIKTVQSLLPPNSTDDVKIILEAVHYSLEVLFKSNASIASSRNAFLLILKKAEKVIHQTVPAMYSDYLLAGIKVATTYFESIKTVSGPDNWNQIILNEIETVQSLLPANTTAEVRMILKTLDDILMVTLQSNSSFASSRNLILLILNKTESVIRQTLPAMYHDYLLAGIKVATTYFESINTVSGSDNWNQIVLNQIKTVQSLLPPNTTKEVKIILEAVHYSLEVLFRSNSSHAPSQNTTLLILKKAEKVIQHTVPEMYSEYLLAGIKVATLYLQSINRPGNWNQIVLNEIKAMESLLSPNTTEEVKMIIKTLDDILMATLQSNSSFASSRNLILLILNKTESIIQKTLPAMYHDYLLAGIKVATTYFESIKTVSGSDNWNQIILNEMKTVQSLLPANTTAEVRMILKTLDDILMVTLQSNSSFASSRNLILLILNKTESVIRQTLPEMYHDYLLAGIKVATTYFESINTVSGSDNWNQIVLNQIKTVQSLLPPNTTKEVKIILEAVHYSLEVLFKSNSSHAPSQNTTLLILKKAEKVIQHTVPEMYSEYLLAGIKVATLYLQSINRPENWNQIVLNEIKAMESLLPANTTAEVKMIIKTLDDILMATLQSNSSFASSRNLILLILNKTESVIRQTLPEMYHDYLLAGIKVATTYFESINTVSGSDNWNQIVLHQMKTVQSLLPPNTTKEVKIILEAVHYPLEVLLGSNSSYIPSRKTILLILKKSEEVIQQTIPKMYSDYLLAGIKVATTYFESINTVSGSDNWNQIVLNEIKTVQSLLPPNTTEEVEIILEAVHYSLEVLFKSNSSHAPSQNTTLLILKKAEKVIQHTVPEMYSEYLLAGIKVATLYLQSINRPENWNQIVLNEIKAMESLLSPNTTEEVKMIIKTLDDILMATLQSNSSFASSRNLILLILNKTESIIQKTLPAMYHDYLLAGIKVATTYFESIKTVSGSDNWNQIILNEMKTIQHFLPPDSTAQDYASLLINITHFILESGQGNTSLWKSFESASPENIPVIFGQIDKILKRLWPLIPGSHSTAPALKEYVHLASVLEQIMTGKADQEAWYKLERMLRSLLSTLRGTELWNSIPTVIQQFEKVIGSIVKIMNEENMLIQSLHMPMVTMMRQIALAVNTSNFNTSELLERMQLTIFSIVEAVQQANATLKCSDVLKIWDPIREAAGLSNATLAMWCNVSMQPVLEAYTAADMVYAQLSNMNIGPMTVNAAAAKIVKSVQMLIQVNINQTLVAQHLIMAISSEFSVLTGRPLSPKALHHWYNKLQDLQLQNSLSSIKELSGQLQDTVPYLRPYIRAFEKAMCYVLDNYHYIQHNKSQELFEKAATIFLHSAGFPTWDIFFRLKGDFSGLTGNTLTDIITEAVELFQMLVGNDSSLYHVTDQIFAHNHTEVIVQKIMEMSVWLTSTKASGLDLLTQALPKIYDILRSMLTLIDKTVGVPDNSEMFEDLAGDIIAMLRQFVSTSGLLAPMAHQNSMFQHGMMSRNHTMRRHRREAPLMLAGGPVDDLIALYNFDYHTMFKAIAIPPSPEELMETAHVFFANPNLNIVMKGATSEMPWDFDASQEKTIDAALGIASFFTLPGGVQMSSLDLLMKAVNMLPNSFPFSPMLKNITRALARESQGNLILMQKTIQTTIELFQIGLTDDQFIGQLGKLSTQTCALENTNTMRLLMKAASIKPGQLCDTFQVLVKVLMMNTSTLNDIIFQTFIGDPSTFNVKLNWTSALSKGLSFNTSDLSSLNISISSLGGVMVGDLLKNKTAFVMDVQQHINFDPVVLHLLLNTTLPTNNLVTLSWIFNLRHCNSQALKNMKGQDIVFLKTFCSMSVEQWYSLSMLMAHHLNMEKFIYRMVLPEDMQSFVGVMLQTAEQLTGMMGKVFPTIGQLQGFLSNIKVHNLGANIQLSQMTRGHRSSLSSEASFVTLSRALCSHGILALFSISNHPAISQSKPSFPSDQREEMIERFKIPRNATPFCTNIYLDMVNTTGGAIAWAFLKPMLMGKILYSPDTPVTRDIMKKANATLQEFGDLRKFSRDWIESSKSLLSSAKILSHTLPMLQNSLGNSFVKNFIEMQTDINVGRMKETLSNFSNMTVMLEKNKHMMGQITALATLMMNLSSCVMFDRYQGYNSVDQLNKDAQDLAKNRNLYASVIFELPGDKTSSRKRHARASSSASPLPPKVSYTIRMHMDNLMRTERVRGPYFVRENHISARRTMRYNRGFIYLQENIDRAIIETQAGHRVTEPAVQLQPFSYPCFFRDEYLEALSYFFPVMLMMAWMLFVADFVKKLVHERELRLHEYMKMMGVNPLSHFFAWFVECATYLLLSITFITLVLKFGGILSNSDGFIIFLYLCNYGLSVLAFSYLISSFFDKTYIAGLGGTILYILCFFPYIVVMALERELTFSQKNALSLFSPTCFSYASQYISRYESQGEGIQWSNSYTSPLAGDTASFGWLCWLLLIDSILYFIIGAYIRLVFPGKYGIPIPWYFPFKLSFWKNLCCCLKSNSKARKGLFFTNIMQENQPVFVDDNGKGKSTFSSQAVEDFSQLPVGVALHGLTKIYGDRVAIQNLNVAFHEGHVTSLLGHNGAGKTTTMSLLTGLFPPTSGTIEVYGRDMETNIDEVRKELGVCMQYDVLFDHMTTKEHLLLYGQIKAPHWSQRELREQVRTILEETGMYAHRHKRVGTLSGGMKRKLSISIAFIGGSRLVVLDEPTTGVDPCSRRNIWDIIIQHKKNRTIIMSTHHLDEAEVLSDCITFLERGGLKCCGSPFQLKDRLGQGYKLTLTKKVQNLADGELEKIDQAELKAFIQAHIPEARLKEAQGGDLVYSLPTFSSSSASSYRSLLTALDTNLEALQLGGYGISDTTLEEVFLQMTEENTEPGGEDRLRSISETLSDTASIDSFNSDLGGSNLSDTFKLTSPSVERGITLAWQQMVAILIKRFHHSRRDWKGLIAQILLPVLFMVVAMGLGSIKKDLQHYPKLELSPELYKFEPSYSFFSNQNPSSSKLVDTMMSFPGIDNACLDKPNSGVCTRSTENWSSSENGSKAFSVCKCAHEEQICAKDNYLPPHKKIPSSQIMVNLSGINVENYLVATANDFVRNRYGGFSFGMPLPPGLQMDVKPVLKNRTLTKVWFNPEGHHTMPAYLNSLSNLILRSNLPADKDPRKYAISVSSHPYFGRPDDEDAIVQGIIYILVAMCVLTGFSITTASFAIYEVSEHHNGSKRLQHIAGISEPFYWTVNFLYDMAIYLIPVILTVAVTAAFQIPAFTDRQNLGAVTVLLVLFGFATFPWMYLLSGVFKDTEMAFITFVCINLFISVNTIISTSILYFLTETQTYSSEAVLKIYQDLSHVFLIFPQFNFGNGLIELARVNMKVQILSGYGIDAYRDPFSIDALGGMILASCIQGLVFFTLRLLLNRFLIRKVRHLICGRKTVPMVAGEEEDEDVAAEHLRVSSGAASSDILQVNQLTKVYQHLNRKVNAVKKISVGIPAGECFGLLGVNGAGKTTTFKMLTGDVSPTDGSAQIRDCDGSLVDIIECRNKGINIGYCPQEDALDELLTGEEHLYFYARIRGISKREIVRVVNYLLKRLELQYHRNIITNGYSCGTRRKLSTALALIGHPQILLLDEPSSGMDPRTKRHLWKIISEEVKGKSAVVLTSHSMEECEALCGRLAIMVKGQFRCLGSLQHIKNRFGSGFTVKMYLAEASCDAEAITGFMQRRFPSTYLKEHHSTMVEYHIPVAPGGVADIFDQLESNKNALQIKHFSVSQTTLDEVFINFALGKIGMETIPIDEDESDDPCLIKAQQT